jgi:hypothetical protein
LLDDFIGKNRAGEKSGGAVFREQTPQIEQEGASAAIRNFPIRKDGAEPRRSNANWHGKSQETWRDTGLFGLYAAATQ